MQLHSLETGWLSQLLGNAYQNLFWILWTEFSPTYVAPRPSLFLPSVKQVSKRTPERTPSKLTTLVLKFGFNNELKPVGKPNRTVNEILPRKDSALSLLEIRLSL